MGVYIINHGDDDDEAGIISGNVNTPTSKTPTLEEQRKWWDEHRRIAPALQVVVPTERPSRPFNKSGSAMKPATKRNPHYVI